MLHPQVRPGFAAPRASAWEARLWRALVLTTTGFLLAVRAAYFLLMWLVTAYEAAMILGTPVVFHLAQVHHLRPEVGAAMFVSASLSHVYLLPAVAWFLLYQGLPSLDAPRYR